MVYLFQLGFLLYYFEKVMRETLLFLRAESLTLLVKYLNLLKTVACKSDKDSMACLRLRVIGWYLHFELLIIAMYTRVFYVRNLLKSKSKIKYCSIKL